MILRPYQELIINKARNALREGFIAPLIVSPTGSGKTAMFADITRSAQERGGRVLILVHKNEILEQTTKSLFQLGVTCGQVAANKPITRDPIQVAMIRTLNNKISRIQKPDLIITDEAHHSTAGQWKQVLQYFHDVPRLGFTATPQRTDNRGLNDMYDLMIEGPSIKSLVDQKFLCNPRIFASPKTYDIKYHIKNGDYDKEEQTATMTKKMIVGDIIDHYKQYLDGMPILVSCANLKHCYLMAEAINKASIDFKKSWRAVVVQGGQKFKKEREEGISGLASGSITHVCFCDVITEGVDVPIVAGVQMLRKTTSLIFYLQVAGRALRPFPGKENAIILDHVGNSKTHGHILQNRNWSLEGVKKGDKKQRDPEITRCPICMAVMPGIKAKCEICGAEIKTSGMKVDFKLPKMIEGQLREILPDNTPDQIFQNLADFVNKLQFMDPKKRQRAMIAKAFQLSERAHISALAKAVGYKNGWSNWVWNRVQGAAHEATRR